MKTSIALVSAALLLGAMLARRPADLFPPRPIRPPRAAEIAPAPETTSLLDAFLEAMLPPPAPEGLARDGMKGFISEIIRFHEERDTEAELAALEEELLDRRAIRRKLDIMKMDLAFENTKLEDILAFIRDFSGLNIILDANFRDRIDPDRAITFKVKDLLLKNTLKLLLAPYQLDYRITEEDVVLITDLGYAATASDPRDLLRDLDPVTTPFDAVLDATRVDLDVQNWPLSAIVDELRARTGLDLRLKGDVEGMISVKVAQIGLRPLLALLLKPRNLTHEIDGVTIWIGSNRY